MAKIKDGASPTFTNYIIPPGSTSACVTLRTDGYYYAASRECTNIKMCFVCELTSNPVYTLRGMCLKSTYSINYYLELLEEGTFPTNYTFRPNDILCNIFKRSCPMISNLFFISLYLCNLVKYQRSTTSGCNNIGIRKLVFVIIAQLLCGTIQFAEFFYTVYI